MTARHARRISTVAGVAVAGVMVAAVLALTGCSAAGGEGSDGSPTDGLASLETTSPTAGAAPVNALVATYGEPVRLRLDMTEEEELAAQAVYDDCVAGESGIDMSTGNAGGGGGGEGAAPAVMSPEDSAKLDAASEACMVVSPLPPWEYDALNPDAVNFSQAIVDCLHERGVTYVEVVEDAGRLSLAFGGEDNDSRSISLGMQYYDACEAEVVAAGGGNG